jgi:small subunit ribosomal protein MRP21
MELRTIGAPLLRSQSPYTFFLPSSTRRLVLPTRPVRPFVCHSCHRFSSVSPLRQQVAAKAPERDHDIDERPRRQSKLEEQDMSILDEAMDFSRTSGASTKQTSRFKSASDKLSRLESRSGRSSVDDALSGFEAPSPEGARRAESASNTPSWAQPRQQLQTRKGRNPGVENIRFPTSQYTSDLEDAATTAVSKSPPRVLSELNIHLSARTGRTMTVDPNQPTDLGTRLRQLEMLVSRNRIRADFNRQKFHERGGLKRKRLASERWRRRFKAGFQRTVTRVQELRRKGW